MDNTKNFHTFMKHHHPLVIAIVAFILFTIILPLLKKAKNEIKDKLTIEGEE